MCLLGGNRVKLTSAARAEDNAGDSDFASNDPLALSLFDSPFDPFARGLMGSRSAKKSSAIAK